MPVLCPSRKLLFIDVPKTGSTSVRKSLSVYPTHEASPTPHANATDVREAVGEEVWSTYFKFGFVRNPVDWVRSYLYWTKDYDDHKAAFDPTKIPGAEAEIPVLTGHFRNWEQTPLDWLTDKEGKLIVDKVYRTEDMDAAMKELGLIAYHEHDTPDDFSPEMPSMEFITNRFKREYEYY
jgi:hypothetical protein